MSELFEQDKSEEIKLLNLFCGRCDTYTVQKESGGYSRIEQPLTLEVLSSHLKGEKTVGAYQLSEDSKVHYLVWDLDPEKLSDPAATAKIIISVLLEEKRTWPFAVMLEASRYPDNSYHVWVFFDPLIPAKFATWLGFRVLELAKLDPKLIEVFPKQEKLTVERPFGNFVKLPLGFHQVEKKWSKILNPATWEPLPNSELMNFRGIQFNDEDIEKIMQSETKRDVQCTFSNDNDEKFVNSQNKIPRYYREMDPEDAKKSVEWLSKYWLAGFRNKLEMYFLAICIKNGIDKKSAKTVIAEVCRLTNTKAVDRENALKKVDYHYSNRSDLRLLGTKGLLALLPEIQEELEKLKMKEDGNKT